MGRFAGSGWRGRARRGLLLALLLSAAAGRADERWSELAEISASSTSSSARVYLDLGSVRWRRRHFEIWELTRYQPVTRQTRLGPAVRSFPETRTLWAVRCPRRTIGLVTLSSEGVFHPREERVKFEVPAPGSPGAMIVAKLCDEMKLRPPPGAVPEPDLRGVDLRRHRPLELPPTVETDDE